MVHQNILQLKHKLYGKKTIDVTAQITKIKGLFVYCNGTLTNYGTITQTGRGSFGASGENIYLWSNNGSYEGFTVPATGASGGAAASNQTNAHVAYPGANGTNRSTAGGGAGGIIKFWGGGYYGTAGTAGNSYQGGARSCW